MVIGLTGDVDFFYGLSKKNCEKLYQVLLEFWDGNIPGIDGPNELLKGNMVFQFGVPPNRIDLLNDIEAVDFNTVWDDKEKIEINYKNKSLEIFYIGLEDLKFLKKLSDKKVNN